VLARWRERGIDTWTGTLFVAALAATLYHEILEKIWQRSAAAFG
jgi:hypothetical protein